MFNKHLNKLGIGAKTLLSHIALALCVVVLSSVLTYVLTYRYVRDTHIDDLLHKAERIAESMHSVSDGEFKPSVRLVRIYQDLTEARVFFLEQGTEKLRLWQYKPPAPKTDMKPPQTEGNETHPEPHEEVAPASTEEDLQWVDIIGAIDLQFFTRILRGEQVSALQHFDFAGGEVLFAGVPIYDQNSLLMGGVVLAQPVEQLNELTGAIRLMIAIVVLVSLLMAIVMATQQTRRLVRPIQRITRAARKLTDESDYAERITGLPNDEIGDLGRTMNSMAARLIDAIRNLREERDKLGLIIAGIGEGLIAVDRQGNIVHYNPVFLELMEVDRIEGLWESEDANITGLKELLKRCMDTGAPESMSWQNHTQRALYAGASPLTDDGGEIIGTVCLLRDMSEAMRMEQLRRDYVANISHELRTPLTGIRGMVEPLIDGYMDTEEERQDSYRVILKETIRLEKLVGEMLDMSRLQDGRVSVELERLELPGILEAAVRSMRQIAADAGVALAVETDGTALACMGNEDRITQVLVILMDNALSFTPAGGTVTVYARDAGDRVEVGVRDTGCGIEPKDLPFIWERFYKADRSRMRTTGTGLGLAIAKLVTELMGGRISVSSEPGNGADFTFTLNK